MIEPLPVVLALVTGAGLGAVYFAGLWWTVRRAGSFRRPASSMLASLLVRMVMALGVFYIVAGHGWAPMLLCLLGFLVGRAAVGWHLRRAPRAAGKVLHAP